MSPSSTQNPSKFFWCDLETTGVDPAKNAVIQCACLIEINGQVVEEIDFNLQPHVGAIVEQGALDVNGYTIEDLRNFPPAADGLIYLKEKLARYVNKYNWQDKFVWAGYWANFDVSFMRQLFLLNNDKYFGSWFYTASLDVASIVAENIFKKNLQLRRYKLAAVCERVGVLLSDAHNAYADIKATRALYQALR